MSLKHRHIEISQCDLYMITNSEVLPLAAKRLYNWPSQCHCLIQCLTKKLILKFILRIGNVLHAVLHIGKALPLRCVNSPAPPLVRCYSIRLPRRVASWVNHSRQRTESCPVSTTPVISAYWRLMFYDVKMSGVRIRTHDLWIWKRVCLPLHHNALR